MARICNRDRKNDYYPLKKINTALRKGGVLKRRGGFVFYIIYNGALPK
jgi:hypothetical protein